MIAFILKRLAVAIPTLLVLIILSFILMKVAPGSPFSGEKAIPEAIMKNILARYSLDKPQWQQLLEYIYNIIFHFDFGPSFTYYPQPVSAMIFNALPWTLGLLLTATFIAWLRDA